MTADALKIDWDTMDWSDEAIFVEASDGSPIHFCVPKTVLGEAADTFTDERIIATGGIEAFIDRAILTRYYVYKAAGVGGSGDTEGPRLLTVEKADFIPN